MTQAAFEKAIEGGARFGFPTVGVKASAVSAAYRAGWVKNKVTLNGYFHITGEIVEIENSKPEMREDIVRLQTGVADLRYRPIFAEGWQISLDVTYSANQISLEQLVNCFNQGGFSTGIGEFRIEKGGTWGAYRVIDSVKK